MKVGASQWLATLPPASGAQRALLERLLAAIARDTRWAWLELGCSVARGSGDELSDLDLGLGVDQAAWSSASHDLPELLRGIGSTVDLLQHRIQEWGSVDHLRLFVQYADQVQVDLVAVPARQPQGVPPGTVVLYDPHGLRGERREPDILNAGPENVCEWSFLGWIALSNFVKYMRRGSGWEAREQLEEARRQIWRLWATCQRASYPVFGLTSLLDQPGYELPSKIEETVAGLDARGLLRAAAATAACLSDCSRLACRLISSQAPLAIEQYVRDQLEALVVDLGGESASSI